MIEVMLLIVAIAFFARRGRGTAATKDVLPDVLAGAATAGIISAEQREALLAYAATHQPSGGRLGGAGWLAVFAGLFVVAGVSLLIARNWDELGPVVRVGAFLLLLLGVGEAAIRSRDRGLAFALPLELVWLFLPLLGIGLYGQTFQLSGDPIQSFLVWLALTAPLAWLSPRPVLAVVHTAALVLVLFSGNYLVDGFATLVGGGPSGEAGMLSLAGEVANPRAWTLSLALLLVVVVQSLRLLPPHHRHHCVGVVALWIFGVLVGPTAIRLEHPGWIVLAAVALATLWVIVLVHLETSIEERAAAVTAWLGTLYALTFTWHMNEGAHGDVTTVGLAVVVAVTVLAVGAALLVPGRRLSPHGSWSLAAKAAFVAPILVTLLYLVEDVQLVWVAAAAMNALLVAIAIGLMWHGSLVHEPAQVNAGVLVLVAMLITRFLDVFGGMLRSGVGFIVAGILLAALAWALERTRRRLIGAPS
jgi:uncharacterized membrane protein